MRAYRIDGCYGAVTEYMAVFADCNEARDFIADSRLKDCLRIVEIEVPDDFWDKCFDEVDVK